MASSLFSGVSSIANNVKTRNRTVKHVPRAAPGSDHSKSLVFKNITVVAPGLLGSSIAMAARQRGLAERISIYARREESVEQLKHVDWCDHAASNLGEVCRTAELIILCAPVERIISLAKSLAPELENNPIVTDVGSVKGEIVRLCQHNLGDKGRFVGSHPMAGSEKTGMENATPDLFVERVCFVTPQETTASKATETVVAFWKALGSKVTLETPDKHDEIVAMVSHLPHIVAATLAAFLSENCPRAGSFCGDGLKDTTRIAAGDPTLWREIIVQNRSEILRSIRSFQDQLQEFSAAIANGSEYDLLQLLNDGKRFRDKL